VNKKVNIRKIKTRDVESLIIIRTD